MKYGLLSTFIIFNTLVALPAYSWRFNKPVDVPQAAPLAAPPIVSSSSDTSNYVSSMIRVGLSLGCSTVNIGTPDGAELRDYATKKLIATLLPRAICKINGNSGIVTFTPTAQSQVTLANALSSYRSVSYLNNSSANLNLVACPFKLPMGNGNSGQPKISSDYSPMQVTSFDTNLGANGYLIAATTSNGLVSINNKLYRGAILILPNGKGTLNIINVVNMEDYLLSVVPSEMPSNWPLEALRAQAIAARSYAYANLGKHENDGYDVKPNTEDQMYVGVSAESNNSNQAVADTTAIVLKYQDTIVPAFFHSTSGGYTDLAQYIWGKDLPYLKSVPDYDDASPMFVWNKEFSLNDVSNKLQNNGFGVGSVKNGNVVSKSPASHSLSTVFNGSKGSSTVNGEDMRRIFNLPSSSFNIGLDDTGIVFAGRGFGHGLGMSQYGAKALAEHGYNAAQILTYYYNDVVLAYP